MTSNQTCTVSDMPKKGEPQRVFLVATGEVHEGKETYTRHDVMPPLCDAETLYTAPIALNLQTDELAMLLERLRAYKGHSPCAEAADMLEAFAAEHERLKQAVEAFKNPGESDSLIATAARILSAKLIEERDALKSQLDERLTPLTDAQAIDAMWKAKSKWMEKSGIDTEGIQHDVPTLYAMLPYFRAGEEAHGVALPEEVHSQG